MDEEHKSVNYRTGQDALMEQPCATCWYRSISPIIKIEQGKHHFNDEYSCGLLVSMGASTGVSPYGTCDRYTKTDPLGNTDGK
jgi:hypothetical protein